MTSFGSRNGPEVPPDFRAFFAEEHRRLFKALYFVTGNRADAAELMQDAFLKLWERWDSDRPDRRSDRLPVPRGAERFPDAGARRTPGRGEAVPVGRFATRSTRSTSGRRPRDAARPRPRQRAALVLLDMYGYGSEEAARIMGIRPSTVRALATQGRTVLRSTGRPACLSSRRSSTWSPSRPNPIRLVEGSGAAAATDGEEPEGRGIRPGRRDGGRRRRHRDHRDASR